MNGYKIFKNVIEFVDCSQVSISNLSQKIHMSLFKLQRCTQTSNLRINIIYIIYKMSGLYIKCSRLYKKCRVSDNYTCKKTISRESDTHNRKLTRENFIDNNI